MIRMAEVDRSSKKSRQLFVFSKRYVVIYGQRIKTNKTSGHLSDISINNSAASRRYFFNNRVHRFSLVKDNQRSIARFARDDEISFPVAISLLFPYDFRSFIDKDPVFQLAYFLSFISSLF